MSRPRTFDHDAARSSVQAGEQIAVVARRYGVTDSSIRWACRSDRSLRTERPRSNPQLLAALRVDGTDPERAAPVTALSARLRTLRAQVRIVGPLCVDSPTVAAAHAAGLTLDDIHEVFAVPPAEAVRAIAAHSER